MDIVAYRLTHKGFRNAEALSQLPHLGAAGGNGIVQLRYRNQGLNGPFVCPVFMPLAAVNGRVNVIKAAGEALHPGHGGLADRPGSLCGRLQDH